MLTETKKSKIKKMCSISNNWRIISALFVAICFTGCVPPIDNSGGRIGKNELRNSYSGGFVRSNKSKKSKSANLSQNQNSDDENIVNNDTVSDELLEFEKKLTKNKKIKQNNAEQKQIKPLPSLKEQIDKLNMNQDELEENILDIKGELIEIKGLISEIDNRKIKTIAGKETLNSSNETQNSANTKTIADNVYNNTFLLDSDEESSENPANSNDNINKNVDNINKNVAEINDERKKNATVNNVTVNKAEKKNVPASSQNQQKKPKSFQITEKPAAKKATVTPKSSEKAASNEINNNINNAKTNDFSEIINKVARHEYNSAVKQINEKMKSTKDAATIANCNYWLGECSFNQKDYAKSIAYFKNALASKCDKSDIAQVRIAESYLRVGKSAEAKVAYQALISDYPKSSHTSKARKMLQQL